MVKIEEEIRANLLQMRDIEYHDFHIKLVPTLDDENIIGVRVPNLRKYAKELFKRKDISAFLDHLPHRYYEENCLHVLIIEQIKEYDSCLKELERFLPYIDNWAVCDMAAFRVLGKNKEKLHAAIDRWLMSDEPYTIRFAINMLMRYYLEDAFRKEDLETAAAIRSEDYYVKMGIAWYFATALAKQYEEVLPILQEKKMETWTHNKTIQKACESYRITDEQKRYLRTLKIKEKIK